MIHRCVFSIVAAATAVLFLAAVSCEAYTSSNTLRQTIHHPKQGGGSGSSSARRKIWSPPTSSSPTSQTQPEIVAQNMLKNSEHGGGGGARRSSTSGSGSGWQLSQSAGNTDTFGSSRQTTASPRTKTTAHGILSPETVARMDQITAGGQHNEAVRSFLRTYRRHGPMSCLEMLSDPEVLPHLTQAMRDSII